MVRHVVALEGTQAEALGGGMDFKEGLLVGFGLGFLVALVLFMFRVVEVGP